MYEQAVTVWVSFNATSVASSKKANRVSQYIWRHVDFAPNETKSLDH